MHNDDPTYNKKKQNRLAKILAGIIGLFLSIIIGFIILLSLPPIQDALLRKIVKKINEKTSFTIQHQHIGLVWNKGITLTEVYITDSTSHILCSAKEIKLQINPLRLLWDKHISIASLHIINGQLNLIREKGQPDFNLQIFLDRLSKSSTYSMRAIPAPIRAKACTFHAIILENCEFHLDDQHRAVAADNNFDPFHFAIKKIDAVAHDITYNQNRLTGALQNFSADHATYNMPIKGLSMEFKITPTATHLQNLQCTASASYLQGDFQITYQDLESWSQAHEKIEILANLHDLNISANDLAHFIPYFKENPTCYKIKGKIAGKLHDLYLKDFYLTFGEKESYLQGSGSIKGLPHLSKTYFHLDICDSHLLTQDLLPHIDPIHHTTLKKIKFCNVTTQLTAGAEKLITEITAKTDIGTLSANLTFDLCSDPTLSTYQGTVNSTQLQIGELLDIPYIGPVSIAATIKGQGLTPSTAKADIETHIKDITVNSTSYTGIQAIGKLGYNFFQGDIIVNDTNCKGNLKTEIDFQHLQKRMLLQGRIAQVDLHTFGITKSPISLDTNLDIHLEGTTWDDWTGEALLKQLSLRIPGKQTTIQQISIKNKPKADGHIFSIDSDVFTLTAEGTIQYTALVEDIKQLLQSYQQKILGKHSHPTTHYKKPYQFNYQVNLKDINPIIQLWMPTLYIAPHTYMQGCFKKNDFTQLEIHLPKIETLRIEDHQFYEGTCAITALQDKQGNLTATANLSIDKHQLKNYLKTNQLQFDLDWHNDTLHFATNLGENRNDWRFNLTGTTTLDKGTIHTTLHETTLQLSDQRWELKPDNAIIISLPHQAIEFNNLCLYYKDQHIKLSGKWTPQHTEQVTLSFQAVTLQTIPYFLNKKINGIIDGNLAFSNTAGQVGLTSDFNIKQIVINDLLIGDFWAKTFWQNHTPNIQILAQLKHEDHPMIDIKGVYEAMHKKQSIDLVASFSNAQLALLTPFVSDVFRQLTGQLDGTFHVKGPLKKLQLTGHGELKELQLQFAYLHASYHGYGSLDCLGNTIQITDLQLGDNQQGLANFHGQINHTSLKDFSVKLSGNIHDLEILNTKYEDNNLFYGKGIVNGDINLTGPIDNMMIQAKAITQKGTQISIGTLKSIEKAEQETYIHFIDTKKKDDTATQSAGVKLQGVNLYLNLEITPDAWAEIIINKKDGDNVQAKGKGILTIQSDAEGRINISGTYHLMEGSYIFSAYGIVKKKFKILPNSTIIWIDQPHDATVSIKALHNQWVSLAPLAPSSSVEQPEMGKDETKENKKYPINILLTLEGKLYAPQLTFDIQFQELPNNPVLQEAVNNFREKIANDKTYLKNQIFSLFLLKSFSSQKGIAVNEKTLTANMNEIVSQQISNLIEQIDENLAVDVDLDVEDMNQEKNTTLPVKISYNLLGERLIITRKSNLNFSSNEAIALADVAGDWSLQYGLTTDNRFKLKLQVFPSSANASKLANSVFSVLSLVHITSFNRWRDLIKNPSSKQQTAK